MKVTQDQILKIMKEIEKDDCGSDIHLADIAEHCGVSVATMRRKFDGLVYQDKVVKVSPMIYELKENA